jgi:hypothetical protein
MIISEALTGHRPPISTQERPRDYPEGEWLPNRRAPNFRAFVVEVDNKPNSAFRSHPRYAS